MTDRFSVQKYFEENSSAWVQASYEGSGYDYPTALARLRKTITIIGNLVPGSSARIADLGCGAGQLCHELVQNGYRVTGVDESKSMISRASQARDLLNGYARNRLNLVQKDLLNNGLEGRAWDVVTALGVIGYMPDDGLLLDEAARLLRPGGLFLVSCRNRLFNMVSISDYTLREIEGGGAIELVEEIQGLLQQLPKQDVANFVGCLATVAGGNDTVAPSSGPDESDPPEPVFTTSVEGRQHTPSGISKAAQDHGLTLEGFYGVHPHLLMAGLNRAFPPRVFNRLSSSLETLDHLPASLIWSSVFIGVFRKAADGA